MSNNEESDLERALQISLLESQGKNASHLYVDLQKNKQRQLIQQQKQKQQQQLFKQLQTLQQQQQKQQQQQQQQPKRKERQNSHLLKLRFNGKKFYLNRTESIETNSIQNKDMVSIKDLVAGEIKTAILCTYSLQVEFLDEHFTGIKNLILIKHWDENEYDEGKFSSKTQKIKHMTVIHPPHTISGGCFRVKMMILDFRSFLRIVICTANLTKVDWYITGQVIWVQDFPLHPKVNSNKVFRYLEDNENIIRNEQRGTVFFKTLEHFFEQINAHNLTSIIYYYDFSYVQVELLLSIPGFHDVKPKLNQKVYGLLHLRNIIEIGKKNLFNSVVSEKKKQKLKESFNNYELFYQSSSISSYHRDNWIHLIPKIISGIEFPWEQSKNENINYYQKKNIQIPIDIGNENENVKEKEKGKEKKKGKAKEKFKIIYPSLNHLIKTNSFTGADCLVIRKGIWKRKKFPKQLFYQCKSYNPKVILHSKILIGFVGNLKFLYLGSHNLSPAAWGQVTNKKLKISNYEMGVVFFKQTEEEWDDLLENLPFKFPPEKYQPKDQPFCFELYQQIVKEFREKSKN
ncbi:tyrosyl-DNA phosphodiesterase [Anaeramoeba flamelloides]|uniref:Tyrosyl-DNA phosphodiesterase n=1 Tax=Anaeramoeba flamelloides TaxID=1746091 RepID=A0AAV8A968_9EUKA|nr:tyrosyl-DNA phosphodiesterase [Anaeramoeba flamelloides]